MDLTNIAMVMLVGLIGAASAARELQPAAEKARLRQLISSDERFPYNASTTTTYTRQLLARVKQLGLDRQNKNVRVLAFGDSITEGWINSRYTKMPWSPAVQHKLQDKLGSSWNVEVVNGGVCLTA
jgi:hypothetical protein